MDELEPIVLATEQLRVELVGLGAATSRVQVADGAGGWTDVHLFLADRAERADRRRNPHLGSTVGRYANRIAGARLPLDGREVRLTPNSGPNQLHGGPDGFDRRAWDLVDRTGTAATFRMVSPDGDQGFPGTLTATATYRVAGDALTITHDATTDASTVVNLCHHSYWTLPDPVLQVDADRILAVDDDGVPLAGGLVPVADTAFDLRRPTSLAEILAGRPDGIDHAYAVGGTGTDPGSPHAVAMLTSATTGLTLTIETDQPALQVYTGNHLRPPFAPHQAISLEAQRFPDTPNRPDLGSARLDPGERYSATTRIRVG